MADRFEDARGVIQDLLGPVDAVTRITSVKGAIRGNHSHHATTQWTFIVSGVLLTSEDGVERLRFPGDLFEEKPGRAHAWRAITDTDVLVFTKGPRSGSAFESDTERLPREDWLLTPEDVLCGACHMPIRDGQRVTSGGNPCHLVCPQP